MKKENFDYEDRQVMKGMFICGLGLLLFLVFCTGCKKEDWTTPISVGTKFTYDYKQYGNRPWTTSIPVQPFTVDSVATAAYKGYNGYWVSSADKVYVMIVDPEVIRGHAQ